MTLRNPRFFIGTVLLLVLHAPAWGQTLDGLHNLTQQEFRLFAEDVGGAFAYHPQTPTEPLGIVGFDVGVALSFAQVRNTTIMEKATSDSVPSYIPVPTLRLDKGLPFGFDVGLMYATVPGSNVDLWGAQARWALLQGGVAMPAVGLRASYSQLRGVDQLAMSTKGLDASISKGFAMLTPYAGVGRVWINAEPHAGTLTSEAFSLSRFFVGAGFKLALFNMNAEVDRIGSATSASLKAGIRF
jgi:hypothetical protein